VTLPKPKKKKTSNTSLSPVYPPKHVS